MASRQTKARFSSDRRYRYALWRVWIHAENLCNFLLLNPSTADEGCDAQTIFTVCSNWWLSWPALGTAKDPREPGSFGSLRACADRAGEEPSEVREPAGRPRKAQANPVTAPGGDLRAKALARGLQVVRPDGPPPL